MLIGRGRAQRSNKNNKGMIVLIIIIIIIIIINYYYYIIIGTKLGQDENKKLIKLKRIIV